EAVFDPRWHLGIDGADDQAIILQRAQLLGQHALGDAGHQPPQLAKALGAALEVVEDDALPLAVDQIEGRLDGAARPMREIPPFHACFPNSIQTGTNSQNLQYLPS